MVEVKEISIKEEWEKFLEDFPDKNFLQSWNWGEFQKSLGKKIFRMGFYENGKLKGVMLSIIETAKRAKYLTVPAGPIMDWSSQSMKNAFKKEIEMQAKANGCSFVRVRPQLLNTDDNNQMFSDMGFGMAPFHLHVQLTLKLDLSKTEDELMASMRKATRYEIRQAVKQGITIESSNDPDDMDAFYDLQVKTASRQAFVPFSREFLKEQFKQFVSDGQTLLYTAKLDGLMLAQGMIIFYGEEADYHYGASSIDGRKFPGAYLLLWEAIREAKKRGLKFFDLWGIAPENETEHRFYGVSLFKRGFGGQVVEYVHARDLVINKPAYLLNWGIEEVRRRTRKL